MPSQTTSPTVSPSATITNRDSDEVKQSEKQDTNVSHIASISDFRKFTLLIAFSIAQFLDILNVSALFSAIPVISEHLSLSPSEAVWLISAYQLTFASFLLLVSL